MKRNDVPNRISVPPTLNDRDIFKDYPDIDSKTNLFIERFEALSGDVHVVKNIEDASTKLESIISTLNDLSQKDLGFAGLVDERRIAGDQMIFVEECKFI